MEFLSKPPKPRSVWSAPHSSAFAGRKAGQPQKRRNTAYAPVARDFASILAPTHPISRFTFHVSRITHHASRITLLLLLTLAWASPASAQPSKEFQLKAVFLYKFALYTEWPTAAFASTNSPLVIGILGSDPFGDYLDQTVRGEVVGGRRLIVQRFGSVGEIRACHILYIGPSERTHLGPILAGLRGKPMLTVTDIEGGALQGVMVRFLTERARIRFRINLEAAKAANLSLSAKLLQVAEVVGEEKRY
jgi:hypothetical protein